MSDRAPRRPVHIVALHLADVAELVDAHGSGPCRGNWVEVRVLSSASQEKPCKTGLFACLAMAASTKVRPNHVVAVDNSEHFSEHRRDGQFGRSGGRSELQLGQGSLGGALARRRRPAAFAPLQARRLAQEFNDADAASRSRSVAAARRRMARRAACIPTRRRRGRDGATSCAARTDRRRPSADSAAAMRPANLAGGRGKRSIAGRCVTPSRRSAAGGMLARAAPALP